MNRRDFLWLGAASATLPATIPRAGAREPVLIGGKNFTEQYLLAEITRSYLEALGVPAVKRDGMSSPVLRRSLRQGQADLCWEYVGTSLVVFNGVAPGTASDTENAFAQVRDLDAAQDLLWLGPSNAGNRYALAMGKAQAQELGIAAIGDLARAMREDKGVRGSFRLAFNTEFAGRRDGLRPLSRFYGFDWPPQRLHRMPTARMLPALAAGRVEVSVAFATDGLLADPSLLVLDDDGGFFPDYTLAPVVRRDFMDRWPDLRPAIETLAKRLTRPSLQSMNRRVEIERRPLREVAAAFLREEKLPG